MVQRQLALLLELLAVLELGLLSISASNRTLLVQNVIRWDVVGARNSRITNAPYFIIVISSSVIAETNINPLSHQIQGSSKMVTLKLPLNDHSKHIIKRPRRRILVS